MPAAGLYSREQSSPLYIVNTAGKAVEVGYSTAGKAVEVDYSATVKAVKYWFSYRQSSRGLL